MMTRLLRRPMLALLVLAVSILGLLEGLHALPYVLNYVASYVFSYAFNAWLVLARITEGMNEKIALPVLEVVIGALSGAVETLILSGMFLRFKERPLGWPVRIAVFLLVGNSITTALILLGPTRMGGVGTIAMVLAWAQLIVILFFNKLIRVRDKRRLNHGG